jgi:hypothetical protein
MKLKNFQACPNHCIVYLGPYDNLESYAHCGVSRYKRTANCRLDANDEGASSGSKKKMANKSSAKQIPSHEDEEEGVYTQRKSLALLLAFLSAITK